MGKSGVSQEIISLPKGGGAIKGIGETFKPNLFTGTANFSVPIATSPGRDGFGPQLTLQYSSGNGNGPFGLGWSLSIPQISRKTEKGLPNYSDEDVFLLSGSEDLVERTDSVRLPRPEGDYWVTTYRPRIEGLFALIEKWELKSGDPPNSNYNKIFWKVITKENITSIYGRTANAVIENPDCPGKIFQWLLELTYDSKGNYVHYEYKKEDGMGIPQEIYENNRRYYQIYLKRILYGNLTPFIVSSQNDIDDLLGNDLSDPDHFFMVVFDYGEHGSTDGNHEIITEDIHVGEVKQWEYRSDPFSSYRSGFEIRTCRICKRVLMFHNKIPGEDTPILVKSTDFLYKQNKDTQVSILVGVTQRGYKKATQIGYYESEEIELNEPGVKSTIYEIKSIPRLDFGYTEFKPQQQEYKPFKAKGRDMPPRSLSDPNFTLVSLFGTGLPDVLQTTPSGYYFWRNLGDGLFDRRQVLKNFPAGVTLDQDGVDFGDMAGDGQADLLVHTGKMWGFWEATNKGGWKKFHKYKSFPTFSLTDPNVRLVDLNGDGRSDVLRTDQHHFSYFPCFGEEGFGNASFVERIYNLDLFPDIYFGDQTKRVHLADMNGDGLKDIVLVHNGRIDYWPNKGYGHFDKRITMKNSPHFGYDFDPSRLFFADIDASGATDLLYIESGKVRFFFNQSGNKWSEEHSINGTPNIVNIDSIQLADMFGNGSTGILWSTDYYGPHQSNYLFLDLTGGIKPYVLTKITNNMGATIRANYTSSTYFYLEDLKKGKHWVTTVPFPVQVLEKVEVIDHIAKSKLVTKYTYHHGFFSGQYREFRGFGRVEQLDTETFEDYNNYGLHGRKVHFNVTIDPNAHIPPILTKSWFHTGAYEDEKESLELFRDEYYNGDNEAFQAHSKVERQTPEAYRALRGTNLRTEIYALDGSLNEELPYTITENGFQVIQLQPKGNNDYGVFFTTNLEGFNYNYERNPNDPRISHTIVHAVDNYGNILKSLDIVYPRRNPEYIEQKKFHIIYNDNFYINKDQIGSPYFVGRNYESRKIEMRTAVLPHIPVLPENVAGLIIDESNQNLFSHVRNYYDGLEYIGLSLGQIGAQGLLTRKEILVFKKGQIEEIYEDKIEKGYLKQVGYHESPIGSDNWWVQTLRVKYGGKTAFFLPIGQLDPIGYLDVTGSPSRHVTTIDYDQFFLLPVKVNAPLKTTIEARNDYYVLSPYLVIDKNLNQTKVGFDPLGFVLARALIGKLDPQGHIEGDPIKYPTFSFEYNFFNYWYSWKEDQNENQQPNFILVKKREEHFVVNQNSRIQKSYTYSDGFGREIQTKIQAEPHPSNKTPRWIGSGWKVYNNKGWVVKQYEPFFTAKMDDNGEDIGWKFEDDMKIGVSIKNTFDPLGRIIRIDNSDGSFRKVEFSVWYKKNWDENDTVKESEWYRKRITGTIQERDAAFKAIVHNDTPTIAHFDVLGRNFLSIEDNGSFGKYETRIEFDIQGNISKVVDPRGNQSFEYKYDLLKKPIYCSQMDSGVKIILLNAVGNPVRKWDSQNRLIETKYDELNRPTELWVTQLSTNTKRLAERIVYGENISNFDPRNNNLLGQVYQHYDESGLTTYEKYDFKGNLLKSKKYLFDEYSTRIDWNNTQLKFTRDSPFDFSFQYDALNRIKESRTPDCSRYIPTYNASNLLEKVDVYIRESSNLVPFVTDINYNSKGQRERITYANGVITEYNYDPETFRITSIRSHKNEKDFQNYHYTYDPVGNITKIDDLSDQNLYFCNPIEPHRDFRYDSIYRLIEASGREFFNSVPTNEYQPHEEIPKITTIPDCNTPATTRRYLQKYGYDEAGNIEEMNTENQQIHFKYHENNNRLLKTIITRTYSQHITNYEYDAHGNHLNFHHIKHIDWNFKHQMVGAEVNEYGNVYYRYDSSGQRIRRVARLKNDNIIEWINLGRYEIYREYNSESDLNNGIVKKQRDTFHIVDDKQGIAIIETLVIDNNINIARPISMFRYQLVDYLDSTTIELNENANIITFEEFYPFGMTSYHSLSSHSNVDQKQYKHRRKEKDMATGLYYYGARYYAPWLSRWINCDPKNGKYPNLSPYCYVANNPIKLEDLDGMDFINFTGALSMGIKFGTHENRVFFKAEGALRSDFFEASGSIETYPFFSKWGRWDSTYRGWETDLTLGVGIGYDPVGMAKWSTTWHVAKSFDEFFRKPSFSNKDFMSQTYQRTAEISLRFGPRHSNNFIVSSHNDTILFGGDGGDSYRTAGVKLLYTSAPLKLGISKALRLKIGLTLDLVTGYVNNVDKNCIDTSKGPNGYYISAGPHKDLSQGALFGTFAVDYNDFKKDIRYFGSLDWGKDSEEIRNDKQNLLVHDTLGLPRVPLLNRPPKGYVNYEAGVATPDPSLNKEYD